MAQILYNLELTKDEIVMLLAVLETIKQLDPIFKGDARSEWFDSLFDKTDRIFKGK